MASSSSITLSIGGVDFVLQPDVNKDSSRLKIDKLSGEGATVHLNNFCGVLRVVRNENGLFSQHGSQLDDNSLANEVENVPSPQVEKDVLGNKQPDPKGQTKLNFRRQSATSATLPSLDNRLKTHPAQTASRPQNDVSHTSKRKHEAGQDSTVVEKKMRPQTKATEEKSADTVSYGKSEAAGGNLHDKPDIFGDLKNSSLGQTMPSQDNESYALSADSSIGKLIPANKRNAKEIVPHGRWGQTMTMIDHRRLVVYGGQTMTGSSPETLSDLYIYDILDKTWSKPINCDGVARTWHSANFLPERQLLLCFGGEILDQKKGKMVTTDQVSVLDSEIMLWYPPSCSGDIPSGRSGHASCVLSSKLVIFGGVRNGRWLNSLSTLDTNRWRWSTIKATGDAPKPRSYATSTPCDNGSKIVIFGGNNAEECFNTLHVLEMASGGWTWSHPSTTGPKPLPRTGHTATLLNDGTTLMIYGGWDPNDEAESDLIFADSFLLDTCTWTWRKGPKAKFEKANSVTATNGGAARVGHSSVLAPCKDGLQVLSWGGRVPGNQFTNDFQSLKTKLL